MGFAVVALDVLLLLSTFILMVALLAAIVRMLRTGRRRYLLAAIATCAWALSSWASIAEGIPPLRNFLGVWNLFILIGLAQLTFIGLTLAIFRYVWGWLGHPSAQEKQPRDTRTRGAQARLTRGD